MNLLIKNGRALDMNQVIKSAPDTVKTSAILISMYGILTVVSYWFADDTFDWPLFSLRYLILVGSIVIAWFIFKLRLWAWALAVVSGAFLLMKTIHLLGALLPFAILSSFPPVSSSSRSLALFGFVFLSAVVLLYALALLLMRESRTAFGVGKRFEY